MPITTRAIPAHPSTPWPCLRQPPSPDHPIPVHPPSLRPIPAHPSPVQPTLVRPTQTRPSPPWCARPGAAACSATHTHCDQPEAPDLQGRARGAFLQGARAQVKKPNSTPLQLRTACTVPPLSFSRPLTFARAKIILYFRVTKETLVDFHI